MGWIKAVGIGPGNESDITARALDALKACDVVIGYRIYLNLIKHLVAGKVLIQSGMRKEIERGKKALDLAVQGQKVCVVSSGDPGIYGVAGLLFELKKKGGQDIEVEVIPGVSAVNSVASLLGAPLMHDFAVISLSDHLTSWGTIEKRVEMAARADFVIAFYNPKSQERENNLARAVEILLRYRGPHTPVGIVKNATRKGEIIVITELSDVLRHDVNMSSTLIIGNECTFVDDGKMVTPRGYVL